jgi:hypothetical protein
MKTHKKTGALGMALLLGVALTPDVMAASNVKFRTVVNNGMTMPDSDNKFNAYNQPSVNINGRVVIRARSKGGGEGGQPTKGIYSRKMKVSGSKPKSRANNGTLVPQPNNTDATIIETPSFPRMDRNSGSFAFRGMSKPVWTYTPEGGEETKIGTTGLYMSPKDQLITGVNQLGVVPEFSYFAVPNEALSLKFDMFPGAPSPVGDIVTFKGNYTVPAPTAENPDATIGKTGVYFRHTKNDGKKKKTPFPNVLVANTDTVIPNGDGITKFGSTAPPSAAGKSMVFAGFDNEETPSMGGIYLAPLVDAPVLTTLVGFGGQVPGLPEGTTFNRLSEGISFNGRYAAFWGAWGSQTRTKILTCPTDGNKDLIAYCLQHDNNKEVQVPVNQGFFVTEIKSGVAVPIALTTLDGFEDFLYWNYSGHVPGSSEPDEEGDDAEAPRWRNATFVAVDQYNPSTVRFRSVFKGTKAELNSKGLPLQGIYLADGPQPSLDSHIALVDTNTPGSVVDPSVAAMSPDTDPLLVTAVGIERDGLRANWLALNASMANADASISWAGVYVSKLPNKVKP